MHEFLSKLQDKIHGNEDAQVEPASSILDDHHQHALNLADEHKLHKDIMDDPNHEKTFAGHLSRQYIERVENDLLALVQATDHPEALGVIAGLDSPSSAIAKDKIAQANDPDALHVESKSLKSQLAESSKRAKHVRDEMDSVRYAEEMQAKKARGSKAFGRLVRQTNAAPVKPTSVPEAGMSAADKQQRIARFSAILRKQ